MYTATPSTKRRHRGAGTYIVSAKPTILLALRDRLADGRCETPTAVKRPHLDLQITAGEMVPAAARGIEQFIKEIDLDVLAMQADASGALQRQDEFWNKESRGPKLQTLKRKTKPTSEGDAEVLGSFLAMLDIESRMQAGGPGSGCNGENCGRPSSGETSHDVRIRPVKGRKDRLDVEFFDKSSNSVGHVNLLTDLGPGIAQTEDLEIWKEFRGQGHAVGAYESLMHELRSQGYKELQSSEMQQEGGVAVWEKLKNKYPKAIKQDGEHFTADLSKIEAGVSIEHLPGFLASLEAGGPGSGCHGENCGRPPGPGGDQGSDQPAPAATTGSMLKQAGWSKGAAVELKGQPATTYTHPQHGTLTVSKSWFEHHDPAGTKVGEKTDLVKGTPLSSKIEKYLKDKTETTVQPKPVTVPEPTPEPVEKPVAVAPAPKPVEPPKQLEVKHNLTDAQIVQRIHDDRLQSLKGHEYQKMNFTGMTPDDRLAYLDKTAQYKNSNGKTDVPNEFAFKDYTYGIKVPKDASPDKLREILKTSGIAKLREEGDKDQYANALHMHTSVSDLVEGLTEKEKDDFVEKVPAFLQKMDDEKKIARVDFAQYSIGKSLSVPQLERLSDNLDRQGGVKGFTGVPDIYTQQSSLHITRSYLWPYSADYEVARDGLFSNWSMTGGGTASQHIIRDASSRLFPVNHGIKFYGSDVPEHQKPSYSQPRMDGHIQQLKKETEDFYKKKFKTNDLSTKAIAVERGIGGHVDTYTPAASESWTVDKKTAHRFGKMMATGNYDYYSIIRAETSYDNVLWTYESAKGQRGWPEEKELKGKKEFVLLGGAIKNVWAEHFGK